MRKLKAIFLLPLFMLLSVCALAQTRTITGKVLASQTNKPVAGASVAVKGTQSGAVTAEDGSFSISAPAGAAVLVVTSVGFAETEQTVNAGDETATVTLKETIGQLSEVVVTALGITKNKKALTTATQTVDTRDLIKARETNVANSLSGKVAGLDVVRSSRGVGGDVRVVLRGDRSFARSSEALVIIDGIPGDLSSLNPDDIASMNVLKGSASALYGSNAANGAIIITTKKGAAGKTMAISLNSSVQADVAVNLHEFQNEYAQGSKGVYDKANETGWGPKITGQTVEHWSIDPADAGKTYTLEAHPDNWDDFYNTGLTFTNGVALSGGGEKMQAYFSYTNTYGKGIVDNNKFLRHNFNFRVNGNITSKLSFDAKITYLAQKEDNFIKSGEDFANVNRQILRLPTNIDINYLKTHYYYLIDGGKVRQNFWNPNSNGGENIYWVKYNNTNFMEPNRVKGMGSLTYQFTPSLSLMLRTGLIKNYDYSEDRKFVNTYVIAPNGTFSIGTGNYTQTDNEFLLSFNKEFGDFSINANGGGLMEYWKSRTLNSRVASLVHENYFTLDNGVVSSNEEYRAKKKNSLYASADIAFRKYLILNLQGRNDWSSSLPTATRSYFYPSAGLAAVISDMVTLPSAISLLKLRGSYAQTGLDTDPYQDREYYDITAGGSLSKSSVKPVDTLKAELTTSRELGLELGLLQNRISLDVSVYKTNSENQLVRVNVPPASGYSQKFINAGNIENKGLEIALNTIPVRTPDFTWNSYINYGKNTNKVVSIYPGSSKFVIAGGFMIETVIEEGKPFGEMYGKGFERDAQGRIVVGTDGIPKVTSGKTVYLGNSRPKWNGGWGNRFNYKDFTLSFLVSARMGGKFTSFTEANTYGDGFAAGTLAGRDGFVVNGVTEDGSANTKEITAESYWTQLGGRNSPSGELFTYDASNIRLRELVLSYNFAKERLANTPFKGASVSLTGRNLFFIKNNAPFDPELAVGTAAGQIGMEEFGLPFTRTFGLNLNLNF